MQIQNSTNVSPDANDPSTMVQQRQRYTSAEWATIKPVFVILYLQSDMTLPSVMHVLGEQYDFHATEQMYKKRIKAWGISKNMKSAEKDQAIQALLEGAEPASSKQHSKVVRHAKARANSGSLSPRIVAQLLRHAREAAGDKQQNSKGGGSRMDRKIEGRIFATSQPPSPQSSVVSDETRNLYQLFNASRVLMQTQDYSNLRTQYEFTTKIASGLVNGMSYWSCNAFDSGRKCFVDTSQMIVKGLQTGQLSVTGILGYMTPGYWPVPCRLIFEQFLRFFVNATSQILGRHHPLAHIARLLRTMSLPGQRLAMWDCMLDSCDTSEGGLNQWFRLAQICWECCMQHGMLDRAAQYCDLTATKLPSHNCSVDPKLELVLYRDHGRILRRQGDLKSAENATQRVLEISSTDLEQFWSDNSNAQYHMGRVHEMMSDEAGALSYYGKAFEVALAHGGPSHAQTFSAFNYLVHFCQKHELLDEIEHLSEQHQQFCEHLHLITDGLFGMRLDADEADIQNVMQTASNFSSPPHDTADGPGQCVTHMRHPSPVLPGKDNFTPQSSTTVLTPPTPNTSDNDSTISPMERVSYFPAKTGT